jgi:hypothetical protein
MKTGLQFKHYLLLAVLLVAAYLVTVSLKYWLPLPLRPPVLLAAVTGMFYLFYLVVKPADLSAVSRLLAILFGDIAALIVIVQHVVVRFDLSYKALIVVAAAVLSPYLAAWLYRRTAGKRA